MGRSTNVADLKLAQKTTQPLIVSGTPGALRGHIAIVNESESKYTFRSAPFKSDKLLGTDRGELTELRVASRIQPRQTGELYFDIPIDPATPAGRYEASIQVGEEHQSIQVQVFEEVALHVAPDSVILISQDNPSFKREFLVENRGNVTLSLGSRSEARLFEADGSSGFPLKEKQSACSVDDNDEPACIVSLLHEDVTLQPGEQGMIEVAIAFPSGLRPHRHYCASVELLTAQIDLHLYTREASPPVVK